MVSFSRKSNVNIGRVVSKLVATLIALWAGGVIVTELGSVMLNTSSPFFKGLSLIGWTVAAGSAGGYCPTVTSETCITATSGSGILAVVGIIGIASIVLEFVQIKM